MSAAARLLPALLLLACSASACGGGGEVTAGRWILLDTRTDQADVARARQNAEDALIRHPGLDGMVGLWSYNTPAILGALRDAGRLGEIQVVAFDEEEETLQGIADGYVHGTVVQQPYEFGYQSVRILSAVVRGEDPGIPEDGIVDVPVRVLRKADVPAFRELLDSLRAEAGAAEPRPEGPETVHLAFITNNTSSFWSLARAGVRKAEADFDARVEFLMPPQGTADDQQRMVEAVLARGVQGIAISPNDPAHQKDLLNRIAARVPLICHDSDAPDTERLCFVGTNNVQAGREAGRLIQEALPEGGEIMLFVGRLDARNALERRQGILEQLAGAPEG